MAAKPSFSIPIPLYKTSVRVCLTREAWKKETNDDREDGSEGCCWSADGYVPIVGLFVHSPGVIAHEMLHATFHILRNRGMGFSNESEESFTYLHEYLVEQTHKRLEKMNASSPSSPAPDADNGSTSPAE